MSVRESATVEKDFVMSFVPFVAIVPVVPATERSASAEREDFIDLVACFNCMWETSCAITAASWSSLSVAFTRPLEIRMWPPGVETAFSASESRRATW